MVNIQYDLSEQNARVILIYEKCDINDMFGFEEPANELAPYFCHHLSEVSWYRKSTERLEECQRNSHIQERWKASTKYLSTSFPVLYMLQDSRTHPYQ